MAISKLLVSCLSGLLIVATAAIAQPLPEAPGGTFDYATVSDALQALHARPDVVFSVQGGWTIAVDRATNTIWSFPPEGNPAYPSAVKRQAVQTKDGVSMDMKVLCQAPKAACDQLVTAFQKLNDTMKQNFRQHQGN